MSVEFDRRLKTWEYKEDEKFQSIAAAWTWLYYNGEASAIQEGQICCSAKEERQASRE